MVWLSARIACNLLNRAIFTDHVSPLQKCTDLIREVFVPAAEGFKDEKYMLLKVCVPYIYGLDLVYWPGQ